ncbi:hypothetical protein PoHVEF18_002335 [Penicillium ochrochloron]
MAKPPTFEFETRTAHSLYLIGATLMAFGLCWGFYVPHTPFPKLALTAHIQCMVEGMMILLSGMLVEKTDIVKLSETQATINVRTRGGVRVGYCLLLRRVRERREDCSGKS